MYIQLIEGLYMVGGGRGGPEISAYKDCNVYLLKEQDQAILFDAGSGLDTKLILSNIEETKTDLSQISHLFITHCHGDHTGGAADMKQFLPHAEIIASGQEGRLMEEGTEFELGLTAAKVKGAYPADYHFRHQKPDILAEQETCFLLPGIKITSILTPGHSIQSVCYLVEWRGKRLLFSGDCIYLNGVISLQNCYGSSLEDYRNYLPRLKDLHIDCLIPAHFGFCLSGGQAHIDKALEYLKSSALPPMV